jgi:nucleoside-diphosphate-sugar epimerase
MVFGRMIHPISSLSQLNASNQIVWQVLSAGNDGQIPPTKAPGIRSFFCRHVMPANEQIVWIDVEDLAETTLRTLSFSGSSHERFLVTQGSYDTQEIADIIRPRPLHNQRIPLGEPGKRIASTHYSCDSSKVQMMLGVEFRSLEESIVPLAEQLYSMEKL